jgi:hypothetical protein
MPFVASERFNAADKPHCARLHVVADPCFLVHAWLTFANGAPTVRLWPIGGRRLLGVFGGADGDAASPTLLPPAVVSVAMPPPRLHAGGRRGLQGLPAGDAAAGMDVASLPGKRDTRRPFAASERRFWPIDAVSAEYMATFFCEKGC